MRARLPPDSPKFSPSTAHPPIPSQPQPTAETARPAFEPAEMPANCGLFVRDRETSVRIEKLQPDRYERSARGSTRVRSTGVARKSPGPTDENGGHTRGSAYCVAGLR